MAIHKDLRSHQYLDDWFVRARSHQACLQHTQELENNVSATGLAGPVTEPSRDCITAIPTGLPGPGIHVLDRLLTATEKQINLGRLHMRLIQWHLKKKTKKN